MRNILTLFSLSGQSQLKNVTDFKLSEDGSQIAVIQHEKVKIDSFKLSIYASKSFDEAPLFIGENVIAQKLHLSSSDYVVSFQSRLGKTPWIKPYTDLILEELRQKKVENIAIVCPSFVSDCLETLEEINIRARAQWLGLGGNDFVFIPCLNTHPLWVGGLVKMIKSQTFDD
jgi:hypothetical protein